MSPYRRNVLVGITMLGAMVMLGWMIIRFGGQLAIPFSGEMMPVRFITDRADGVSEGSGVYFRGVSVGRVLKVARDPNLKDIWIDAELEIDPPLPAGVTAIIRQASLLGSGARMELVMPETPSTGNLAPKTVINATYAGLDFFPPEVRGLSTELAAAARQFRESNIVGNANKRLEEIGLVLAETRVTLENANKIVGDDKMRKDIATSVDNIRVASENVKNVTARADKIAESLERAVGSVDKTARTADTELAEIARTVKSRLEEMGKIVQQANEITAKINQGQGTAGKIINDPKLYEGLVETTAQLSSTVKDLQRLIQQWEQEGVSLKLK